jgi:hypothetical protein
MATETPQQSSCDATKSSEEGHSEQEIDRKVISELAAETTRAHSHGRRYHFPHGQED